jgi:hypothetical protein
MIPATAGSRPDSTNLGMTPMMRRLLLTAFALLPLVLAGCATTKNQMDDSKIATVARDIGISTQAAQGGLGAMLSLARNRLDVGQFQQIAEYIPNADKFISGAQAAGVFQGDVTTTTQLHAAYAGLGMTPDQSAKLQTAVTDFVKSTAGPALAAPFAGALE